jgi:hypothetical protein
MSGRGGQVGRGGKAGPPVAPSSQGAGPSSLARIPEKRSAEERAAIQSGDADWQTVRARKAEERQALFRQWEAERRANHPELYELGYTDAQVRVMVRSITGPQSSRGSRGHGRGHHPAAGRGGVPVGRGGGQHTFTRGGLGWSGPNPTAGHGRGAGPPVPSHTPGKRKFDGATSGITPPPKRSSGGGQNYADVVMKNSFPHMLQVFKGKEGRIPVPEDVFSAIAGKLRKRVLAYSKEDGHMILQTAFIRNGKIACKNSLTSAWFKEEVDKIAIDGVAFRAWSVGEPGALHQARMHATGLDGIEPEEVVDLILGFTPDLKGKITFVRAEKSGSEDLIVLGIDDDMASSLANREEPWTVNLGTDQRKISFSGKKALMERLASKEAESLANAVSNVSVSGEGDDVA